MKKGILVVSVALLLGVSLHAQQAALTGRVRVAGRPEGLAVPTFVYAEPLGGSAPKSAQRARLAQRGKAFEPRVQVLPAGSKVDFPNEDTIYHNIFSLSSADPFDLGLYSPGASKTRTFAKPAKLQVFCNIHPQMTAVLLIVSTPYITEAEASGSFRLELPPGRYRVTAWSERSEPRSTEITVGAGGASIPELALDESSFVELPHKNKYGQDYPKLPGR